MKDIMTILKFVLIIAEELQDLYEYIKEGKEDEKREKQIMMNIIRKTKDAEAKKEIEG